jgi:hypothetical protein
VALAQQLAAANGTSDLAYPAFEELTVALFMGEIAGAAERR